MRTEFVLSNRKLNTSVVNEDKALQDLGAVLKEVHERNKEVSEEEVVRYATQAIAGLREEEYASQKKA